MRHYAHTNPNVVVSLRDGDKYCTYREVLDGIIDREEVLADVALSFLNEWREITSEQSELILQNAISRYFGKVSLAECFTTIDIHMFSVNL